MNCPRCKKVMDAKQYENINIDACPQCGGIWLDAGELQLILSARDVQFAPSVIEQSLKEAHANISKAEQETILACPQCSTAMHPLNYNYSSGVILNTCPNGDGVWFDKEELAKVQIFMEHWDDEEKQEKWKILQAQTRLNETAQLDQSERMDRSKSGPIGKAIDAFIDLFSSSK